MSFVKPSDSTKTETFDEALNEAQNERCRRNTYSRCLAVPLRLWVRNLTPRTIQWYAHRLNDFARTYPDKRPGDITSGHIRDYLNSLTVKPSTRNGALRSLRAFFAFCVSENLLTENPARQVQAARQPQPLIPTFSDDQIAALLKAIRQDQFTGCRDFALILLLFDTGSRISEALNLKLDDLQFEPSPSIRIQCGKGGKGRELPLGRIAAKALLRYIARRKDCPNVSLRLMHRWTLGRPQMP